MARRRGPPRIGLISLGCAKNEVDAERILGAAAEGGWLICGDPADADVVVVNTCGFIAPARAESRSAIEEALALKRAGSCRAVIVAGCLAERSGRSLREEFPEVDAWVGIADPRAIPELAARLLEEPPAEPVVQLAPMPAAFGDEGARLRITPRHYAYLRIAEGCDNRCAYCAIPLIRGPLRSKPIETCLAEARDLAADGCRELILIAQDTTNYGRDLYGEPSLPRLLDALVSIEEIRWLRVLYAHPAHFDAAVLDAFARHPKLCRYVDLPIQHASDRLLERMGRRTTRAALADLFARIRDRLPDAVLRTTALVGYPGETEEDFAALLDFLAAVEFDRLGGFAYSDEEGTRAASEGPPVPEAVRAARLDELMRRQQPIAFRKAAARVGTACEVVLDARLPDGRFAGRSGAEAPDVDGVVRVAGRGLRVGQFIPVRITAADGYDLEARPRSEPTTGEDRHGSTA
jgi:ribosomal protein S12 methylthiotransferase